MSRFTKKYMVEDYERLRNHSDLLELYLWDTQGGQEPDAVERYRTKNGKQIIDDVRIQLWRATSATGGYVVVLGNLPNIWYLDDAIRTFQDNSSEHTLGIRICLERLRVARNKMLEFESVRA